MSVGRFTGWKIVTGKVNVQAVIVLLPVAQDGQSKIGVHEPADFQIWLGTSDASPTLHKLVIQPLVVGVFASPGFTKLSLRHNLLARKALPHIIVSAYCPSGAASLYSSTLSKYALPLAQL